MFLFSGALLIATGTVIIAIILRANLPSPFDVVTAPQEEFLPLLAPANPGAGTPTPAAPTLNAGDDHLAEPSPVAQPVGMIPNRLVIPSIHLDAPIIPVSFKTIKVGDQEYTQWLAPDQFAAGWQDSSALLGLPGNTVLFGHHNAYGAVFKELVKLNLQDVIILYSGSHEYRYQVVAKLLLPERYAPLEVRLENARWMAPSLDDRITLISCWPADNNTHRVVVVATPIPASSFIPNPEPQEIASQPAGLSVLVPNNPLTYTLVGDKLQFSYQVTNNGEVALTAVNAHSDPGTAACPQTSLAPAGTMTCTLVYYVRNKDMDLEQLNLSVTIRGFFGEVPVQTDPIPLTAQRSLKLSLHPICTANPETENGWLVENNNPYRVSFEYAMGSGLAGVNVVSASSKMVFTTPANSGSGVMSLYAAGILQMNARAASGCQKSP